MKELLGGMLVVLQKKTIEGHLREIAIARRQAKEFGTAEEIDEFIHSTAEALFSEWDSMTSEEFDKYICNELEEGNDREGGKGR